MINICQTAKLEIEKLNAFYQEYLNVFRGATDAPLEFILLSLLASLGAAISTQRWITWGNKKIYPNMWVMLVGPSTLVRKTTSLNTGLYFNHRFDQTHKERNFILPNDGSFAALLEVLECEKHGVLQHSEVASLLETMSKGYNNNMKSLFTDFFDVPRIHKIHLKGSDDIYIENPIFSMGAGTTINWLKQNITKNDRESGFLARFLYCCKDRREKSVAIPQVADPEKIAELSTIYDKLFNLEPREISIDSSYAEVYTEFYVEIERTLNDPMLDEGTKSLIGRLQTDYFVKLTILECVLTGKDIATEKEATNVKCLIRYFIQQAFIIMDKILKTEQTKNEEKVLEYLNLKKRASNTDIHHLFNNNLHASGLKSIMGSLMEAQLVKKTNEGRTVYYELFVTDNSATNS